MNSLRVPGSFRSRSDNAAMPFSMPQALPNRAIMGVIVALTVILLVLDILTPLGIVIWVLYVIPLGLTNYSSIRSLLPISAGVCSVLIIFGYLYSPPGVPLVYTFIDRALGIGMLWAVVYFLRSERDKAES